MMAIIHDEFKIACHLDRAYELMTYIPGIHKRIKQVSTINPMMPLPSAI